MHLLISLVNIVVVSSPSLIVLSPNDIKSAFEHEDDLLLSAFAGNGTGNFVGDDRRVRNFLGEVVGEFSPTEFSNSSFLTPFIDIAIITHTQHT